MRKGPTIKYKEELEDINEILLRADEYVSNKKDSVLKQSGDTVKEKVEIIVPRSDIEERYVTTMPHYRYEKSKPYVHVVDDVVVSVRTSKTSERYVSIHGGKYTGYKWHWLNDGWTMRNGQFHAGIKFMEKALEMAKRQIEGIVDRMIEEAFR